MLGLFALVHALTDGASSSFVVLENDVPVHDPSTSSWINGGLAPKDAVLVLTVQLAMSDAALKALETEFWAVSNPTDPKYGQHLPLRRSRTSLAWSLQRWVVSGNSS